MVVDGGERAAVHAAVHCLWVAIVLASAGSIVNGAGVVSWPAPKPNEHDSVPSTAEAPPVSVAKLSVEEPVCDVGQVKPGSNVVATFRLTNVGPSTLRITDVKRCCGVATELDKREIAPDETVVLRAVYHVPYRSGAINKKVEIETDDPGQTHMELTMVGQIVPTLAWTPDRFKIVTYEGDVSCPQITLSSLDGTAFGVRRFAATKNCLTAAFDPNRRATEFVLSPIVCSGRLDSLRSGNGVIRIELDHPDYKAITINFSTTDAIQASPAEFILFNAKVEESVISTLRIQDNQAVGDTNTPIRIESVTAKGNGRVQLKEIAPTATGCTLTLEIWPPRSQKGDMVVTDELLVMFEDGRKVVVPVRAVY